MPSLGWLNTFRWKHSWYHPYLRQQWLSYCQENRVRRGLLSRIAYIEVWFDFGPQMRFCCNVVNR